jgi:hypothetical protein
LPAKKSVGFKFELQICARKVTALPQVAKLNLTTSSAYPTRGSFQVIFQKNKSALRRPIHDRHGIEGYALEYLKEAARFKNTHITSLLNGESFELTPPHGLLALKKPYAQNLTADCLFI